MHWLSKKRYVALLLVPTLLLYTIYIIAPIFITFFYSFTKYSGIGAAKWVGLKNYKRLIHDDIFWVALKNTMIIFCIAFILLIVISFLLALVLNSRIKGTSIAKSLIFSPAVIAPIIVGIIWVYILDPHVGIINALLGVVGLSSLEQEWIGGNFWSPFSIAIIYVWQQLGYLTTIFVAGLKMIPDEVNEAVRIDGASWPQTIRFITIPMMKSTFSTVSILLITGIFKIFEIVQQTTNGGPNHLSETLVTYSYSTTFKNGEYGYGMSLATVTFIISLIITGVYMLITRERGEHA